MTSAEPRARLPMRIDFVSDIVCPWCVIGLKSLETALDRARDVVVADIHFQPFELNPGMPPEGQNIAEHIMEKYGSDPDRAKGTRELIRTSAAEFGFIMATDGASRIWNTFDSHRLLHWAGHEGRQAALKGRLFEVYFSEGGNPSDRETLVAAAAAVGLDADDARAVLASGAYAEDVRRDAAHWRDQGIHAVPAIVINHKYVITGGQSVAAFERAVRSIAAEAA